MRKAAAVNLFFLLTTFFSHAQLNWINPKPTGYINNKIVFTDSNNGFIFNNNGYLMKTTDQGSNWKVAKRFGNMTSFGLFDSTAVIAGYSSAIYISTDNGSSWQIKSTGLAAIFTGVDIVSRDTIFLSSTNAIYKSFNRGQTWQTIALPPLTVITCFDFANGQTGFVGTNGPSIYRTSNGGQSWQATATINTIPSDILSIKFLNKDTGYAFRQHDQLLKTTNSGFSWTATSISSYIYAMSFATDSIGFLAGADGFLYKTINAGSSWNIITSLFGSYDFKAIYFLNPNIGFVAGLAGEIAKTTDGGSTWQLYSPFYADVKATAFPDAATGYTISYNSLFKTLDSGKTWIKLPLSPTNYFSNYFDKLQFSSRDSGFIVTSDPAKILRTTNGGQSWTSINPAYYSYTNATGLSFVNDSTGFMSLYSNGSYLLTKTKDMGSTWKTLDSTHVGGEFYTRIHFLNEKTGYSLRNNQMYKTSDSGRTWVLQYTSANSTTLTVLNFVNEKTGIVGDDNNGNKRTNDSGHSFTLIPFDYLDKEITAMKFIDQKIGYATCSTGNIYQTADSGATWTLYNKGYPYTLTNSISLSKDKQVYFGGTKGTILSASTAYVLLPEKRCPNSTAIFVSDISGATYSWQLDANDGYGFQTLGDYGSFSGTATNTLTIANTASAFQGFKFRCVVNGIGYSKTFVLEFETRWTGLQDNNWENPNNWNCGSIPDQYSDVVIGYGTVTIHSNGSVKSIRLLPGSILNVDPGFTLNIAH